VSGALHLGAVWTLVEHPAYRPAALALIVEPESVLTLCLTFGSVALGAVLAVPICSGLTKLLMPPRAARALQAWLTGEPDAPTQPQA
jgi:hypothetical protein